MGKSKKKGSGANQVPQGFDYKYLIPDDLDDRTRDLMERFLRNEEIPTEERQTAIDTFVRAIKKEQAKYEEPSDMSNDSPPVTGLVPGSAMAQDQPQSSQSLQANDFEPNPDCLSEDRQRINVGWMASSSDVQQDTDRKIAVYCQRLGCQLYNFISYPIGGGRRGFWKVGSDLTPPPLDLPDLQLQNHLWETYVNGVVSEWIDCDSADPSVASLSERELLKELNYAVYMGLRSVIIRLQHASSPNLSTIINKWLWTKSSHLAIWIFVPTDLSKLQRDATDSRDCWEIWADFRSSCCNFSSNKLIVGLHVTSDLDDEFISAKFVARWKSEPYLHDTVCNCIRLTFTSWLRMSLALFLSRLAAFWVDSDVFGTDPTSQKAIIPLAHKSLLRDLWMSDNSRIVVRDANAAVQSSQKMRLEYAQTLRAAVRDVCKLVKRVSDEGFLSDGHIDYVDVLQAPLQPLADNLDSNVYNTFEQDPIKYKRYREAVEECLKDLGESSSRPNELVLYVLGAGRGPLVTASLEAEKNYNERFRSRKDRLVLKVFVVEKNPNAIVTLRFMNERAWRNRCEIVETDMRGLPEVARSMDIPQPDIIVSELLGSFGDNELSPECLDGVTSFLKSTTISIPQKYTSYAVPIMSCHLHQVIRSAGASYWNSGVVGPGRHGPVQQPDGAYLQLYKNGIRESNMDQIYVVFLRQYCALGEPKPVFTFEHPNFELKSNARHAELEFDIDRTADVMGFAGYFHMNLYKDITLSIEPSTYSKGMISWFPAVIPLRTLHRVHIGDQITFVIDRKVDDGGVWYEWNIRHKRASDGSLSATDIQNVNGDNYYMKLH